MSPQQVCTELRRCTYVSRIEGERLAGQLDGGVEAIVARHTILPRGPCTQLLSGVAGSTSWAQERTSIAVIHNSDTTMPTFL